jgi:hypothetical protein
MNTRITLLAIALTAACAAASAEQLQEKRFSSGNTDYTVRSGQPDMQNFGPPPDFASLDNNGDGRIDVSESHGYAMLYIDYEFADLNRDKVVSRSEYTHWVQHGEDPASHRR